MVVEVFGFRIDMEQAGDDLTLGGVLLQEILRAQAIMRIVIGIELAQRQLGAVVLLHHLHRARLDGAGPVREFLNVGLPALRGEIAVAMTLTMIAALRTFDLVYIMTPNGGPDRSTAVPSYGGLHPSRIRDAHVVGTPRVHMLSLRATGTPARGPGSPPEATVASTASADARARSAST